MDKLGYSINIYFQDWSGGRNFGIDRDDDDNINLTTFRDFCWDAGIVYGFTESQMNSIFNFDTDIN